MFTSTARNLCFRTLLEEYCSNERGTTLPQSAFDLMTMALFGMLSLSGVQSVWFLEIRSEHIDIDAASFGIIECSEAGILRSCIFTFLSITLEFKILRSASESPSLRILGMIRCSTGQFL
jgi:hypothetical protein